MKSVQLTLSGVVNVGGERVPFSGTGLEDLANRTMSMTMHMSAAGSQVDITELLIGSHIYMKLSGPGISMKQLTGHDWGEIQLPGGITTGTSQMSDPMQMLQYLTAQGATVTQLGPATVGGELTTGYAVAVPHGLLVTEATKRLNAVTGMSASERASILQAIDAMPGLNFKVWFDKTDHLLRRMVFDMSLNFAPGASGATTMTMTFSKYGQPVHVVAPSPGDVGQLATH